MTLVGGAMGTFIAQIPDDPGHRKGQPGKRSRHGRLPTRVCAQASEDHEGDQTTDCCEREDDHDNSVPSSGREQVIRPNLPRPAQQGGASFRRSSARSS